MQQWIDALQAPQRQDTDLKFNIDPLFTQKIMSEPLPSQFKIPQLEPYDETADLMDHLENFKSLMLLQEAIDVILY